MTNTTTPAKKVKKRQTSHIEFFKLCEWVKSADLSGISTFVGCAELASKDVGSDGCINIPINSIFCKQISLLLNYEILFLIFINFDD